MKKLVVLLVTLSIVLSISSCEFLAELFGLNREQMEQVSLPILYPLGGEFLGPVLVEITCDTDGSTIYYTLDGSPPTELSTAFTEPIAVETDTTIKAFAVKLGMTSSGIVSETYTFAERLKIGALFWKTGAASWLGLPEARTVEMLTEMVNASGGVSGRYLDVMMRNTGEEGADVYNLAEEMIGEGVLAIIGPSSTGETMAIKDLCEDNDTILISCGAGTAIVDPVASHVFKTPPNDIYAVEMLLGAVAAEGLSQASLLVENGGFGANGRNLIMDLAPTYGIDIIAEANFNSDDTVLTGVLTALRDSGADVLIVWGISTAQGFVKPQMEDIAFDVPLFLSHGFGYRAETESMVADAEGAIFVGSLLFVADSLPADHPRKEALIAYKQSYENAYGEPISPFGGHAHDAFKILIAAVEDAGFVTGVVRTAIENISNFDGIAGTYSFSPTDHNGIGAEGFILLTIQGGEIVEYGT